MLACMGDWMVMMAMGIFRKEEGSEDGIYAFTYRYRY